MKMTFPETRVSRSWGGWGNDVSRLFDSLWDSVAQPGAGGPTAGFAPVMDIRESEDRYVLGLDLPGVKLDDTQIEIDGDLLVIHGSRSAQTEAEGERFHRVERWHGSFRRAVRLPQDVDREKISADYTDGVLSVHLPKSELAQPRKIEIRSGDQVTSHHADNGKRS